MVNGVDVVGTLITFGVGFILGVFFGMAMAVMMEKSDKEEEDHEERE